MKLEKLALPLSKSIEEIDSILSKSNLYSKLYLKDRQKVAKYILGCNQHNIKILRVQYYESYYASMIWPTPSIYLPVKEYTWSIQVVIKTKRKKVKLISLEKPYDKQTDAIYPVKELHKIWKQRQEIIL